MPTPTSINLRERYGRRYRVAYEPSYHADHGPNARIYDPWLMVIPRENGHICPWGGSTLAACTKAAGSVANRLKALSCTTVAQDGSDGANVLFDVEHFDAAAKIMRPRRRRQVSPQERERLKAMGFKKGSQAHVEEQYSGRTCVSEGRGDPEHLPRQRGLFGD